MSFERILIVEDNLVLAQTLGDFLTANQFEVDFAYQGSGGLQLLQQNSYDLVIADINLPKLNGLTMIDRLRKQLYNPVPVLFLSALSTESDKISGFEVGGDDYLTKPFSMSELLCRVKALLCRGKRCDVGLLHCGELTLDQRNRRLCFHHNQMELHKVQVVILETIMRHHPDIVSRDLLERTIWEGELPESSPLRTHIYRLRKNLVSTFGYDLIETIYGQGYRLRPAP